MTLISFYNNFTSSNPLPGSSSPAQTNQMVDNIFNFLSDDKLDCSRFSTIIYQNSDGYLKLDYVSRAIDQCKDYINEKFTKYLLSPLHLAVIKGNAVVASMLLAQKADVDSVDYKGYTPIQHAAMLGNQEMVDFLKIKGANTSVKNMDGSNSEDIQRFNRKLPVLEGSQRESFIKKFNFHFSPSCLRQNVTLINENIISSHELLKLWGTTGTQDNSFSIQSPWLNAYHAYKKAPPKLQVAHITKNDLGSSLSIPSNPCGVFAEHTIKAGQIIAEYVGEMTTKPATEKPGSAYRFEDIDGQFFRNEAAMINDGFPNSCAVPIYNVDGMIKRYVLVALEEIKPGQEIVWNYNYHESIKLSGHQELRPKALNTFFKNFPWENLYEIFYDKTVLSPSSSKKEIERVSNAHKLSYLFSTPTAFLSLLENKVIGKNLIDIMKKDINKLVTELNRHTYGYALHMVKFFDLKSQIEAISPKLANEATAVYRKSLHLIKVDSDFAGIHATGIYAFSNLLKGINSLVSNADNKNGISNENKEKLFEKLREDLRNMQFQDPQNAGAFLQMSYWSIFRG